MVEVVRAGLFDTIQDLGRPQVQHLGIPYSGVMDRYSAVLANAILGNHHNDALIESTFQGPTLKFRNNTKFCVSGANANPKLNGQSTKMNTAIAAHKGDVLSFGKFDYGCRIYIAVSGGFQTEMMMNSRSMYPNITKSHRLSKGDVLPIEADPSDTKSTNQQLHSAVKPMISHFESQDIEVFKGPAFEMLDSALQSKLFGSYFTISTTSNRMAYQLEERLINKLGSMITSLVLPGTVQLTPSGKLIVLMRDCQTTGGYPRVFQLTQTAINRLSQKRFGEEVKFRLVDG